MRINFKNNVQTVSEITHSIKVILENGFSFITVSGEVSNLRKPYSGHLYFTLKDSKAQLKAVLFKTQARYLSKPVKEGDQIICRGRISVYDARGDYQIIVDSVDHTGSGALQIAFERLKQKLSAQGMFDQENKKQLPFLPERIAVITSPQGAAIHDFLKIAAKRFPAVPIEIYPAPMQGEQSASEIIAALQLIQYRATSDVIVICRGGGSIEDLWSFNDEELANEVFKAKIPIVSAIGHEVDFTILDFAADYRAPTPTAAAEAVLPDKQALCRDVNKLQDRISRAVNNKIAGLRHQLTAQNRLLATPANALQGIRLRIRQAEIDLCRNINGLLTTRQLQLDTLTTALQTHSPSLPIKQYRIKTDLLRDKLAAQIKIIIERKTSALQKSAALLDAVSPLAILARGYAIARILPDRTPLRSVKQIKAGDSFDLQLKDGNLACQVKK